MPAKAEQAIRATDLVAEYERYKLSRSHGGSMASTNWVTTLCHECEAYAFFNRTVPPERRRKIEAGLAMLFSEGDEQARIIKRDLTDMGYEITGAEGQLVWKEFEISGRRDLEIWKPGMRHRIRMEIKSCSPFTFDKINSVEDLRESQHSWLQKYAKQVSLYMVLEGVTEYFLMLKNKSSGRIKIIEFHLGDVELEAAEKMLQKAQRVNKLIQMKAEQPPNEMKVSDADICSECMFYDTCLPDLSFGPGAVIFDEESVAELVAQLDRRAELEPVHKEFKKLDEDLKQEMKMHTSQGQEKLVIGPWLVEVKEQGRKAFSVEATSFQVVKFFKP